MSSDKRIVYQFPVSHYCEKTRWNLDAKGLAFKTRDVVPGAHLLFLKRRSGVRTVPMLTDRGRDIGDSTKIALYLEDTYPERPLIPRESAARGRVVELDAYFSDVAGVAVRQWIYGTLMQAERGSAAAVLLDAYPLPVRLLGKLAAPRIEGSLRKMYRTNAEGIAKAHTTILAVADKLEAETQRDPSRYLVGDSLTLADISAASLLSPIIAPPESPYVRASTMAPPAYRELQAALRGRPAGAWVMERYRRDRAPS